MKEEKVKKLLDAKKQKYLVIAMTTCIICGILLTSWPLSTKKSETPVTQATQLQQDKSTLTYEEALELRLTNILKKLEGAGRVQVMITTYATSEKILAEENTHSVSSTNEKDATGGTRTSEKEDTQNKIILGQSNAPIVVQETQPQIEGVLVIAEGAGVAATKNAIIESVSSLLNVPVHKISVFKMRQN